MVRWAVWSWWARGGEGGEVVVGGEVRAWFRRSVTPLRIAVDLDRKQDTIVSKYLKPISSLFYPVTV